MLATGGVEQDRGRTPSEMSTDSEAATQPDDDEEEEDVDEGFGIAAEEEFSPSDAH